MPARNRRQEDIRPYELDFITHEPRKLHEHGAECDGCEGLDARGGRGGGGAPDEMRTVRAAAL